MKCFSRKNEKVFTNKRTNEQTKHKMSSENDSSDNEDVVFGEEIPDQVMDIERIQLALGQLFKKTRDGKPILFDSSVERIGETDTLRYRIPLRQRHGANNWTLSDKQLLVDSIFKGIPIQGITVSEQSRWRDLEDGASRLTVLQTYYNDGFVYKNKKFSELDTSFQKRFEQYQISIDVVRGTADDIDELFQRLNRSKPLQDADRYYSMQRISPLVDAVFKLMQEPFWEKKIFKTYAFSDTNRKCLPDVCGLAATLAFGENYTSTSSARLQEVLRKPIPTNFTEKARDFCKYYYRIIHRVNETDNIFRKQMCWHKISKQCGLILQDYIDNTSPMSLKEKEDMWVEIMTIARSVEHFFYNKQTLFASLPKGVRQNTLKSDFQKKLERIRKFYDNEGREDFCLLEGIEWQ